MGAAKGFDEFEEFSESDMDAWARRTQVRTRSACPLRGSFSIGTLEFLSLLPPEDRKYFMPKPSVGRIVHYVIPAGQFARTHRPAIVTEVFSDTALALNVFKGHPNDFLIDERDDEAMQIMAESPTTIMVGAEYDGAGKPGTWHWPEMV